MPWAQYARRSGDGKRGLTNEGRRQAERTRNDDGLLDFILFHRSRAFAVLQFLRAVTLRDYSQCGDLDYLQSREFRVECAAQSPYQIDGEFAGRAPVHFKPAPFRLKVAV